MLIPQSVFNVARVAEKAGGNRFATQCVQIERDKETQQPIAVATDGKRLLVVRWDEADAKDFPEVGVGNADHVKDFEKLIPAASMLEAQGMLARQNPNVQPVLRNVLLDEPNANGTVSLGCTDVTSVRKIEVRVEDGLKFPNWRLVMPIHKLVCYGAKENRAVSVAIDGKMLKEMIDAVQKATGNNLIFLHVPLDTEKTIAVKSVNLDTGVTAHAVQVPITGAKEGTQEEKEEKKSAKPKVDGFEVRTRKIGDAEHWVLVEKKTGKVFAQQPIDVEFLTPDAMKHIRITPAETAVPAEELKDRLEEAPAPLSESDENAKAGDAVVPAGDAE